MPEGMRPMQAIQAGLDGDGRAEIVVAGMLAMARFVQTSEVSNSSKESAPVGRGFEKSPHRGDKALPPEGAGPCESCH